MVEHQLKDRCGTLSKEYPKKKIAFVTVDCFGGKCTFDGFVMQDGNLIYENENHHSAHVKILKQIEPAFLTWHFYPFTRDFYSRKAGVKGGIVGDVINFTLAAIWMSFNIEFGKQRGYNITISKNELVIEKTDFFEFYFMVIDKKWIKILGRIYNDSEENLLNMEKVIKENLDGLDYKIQFDLFENGYRKKFSTISAELSDQLSVKSYREHAFNEMPFITSETATENRKRSYEEEYEDSPLVGNVFKRIFNAIFGS